MVAQQCCWLVRDPVMLSDCLLIRNPNNTFLNEFAFVMSCHCVSRFLAVGGACLRILWLGNRVLHDSQHSQFGNFILIAFFLTTMWVMRDPWLPMQSVGSYASISCAADWSARLSKFPWLLAYLVFFLFKFYFLLTALLVVWDFGLAMKLGRVLHIHFPCWLFGILNWLGSRVGFYILACG